MNQGLFQEIDFERYNAIMAEMWSGAVFSFAVLDKERKLLWSNQTTSDHNNELIEVCTRCNDDDYKECLRAVQDDRCDVRACYALKSPSNETLGYTLFRMSCDDAASGIPANLARQNFINISSMMQTELAYIDEVNNLALELGKRYDELAMFRASDNDTQHVREARHILSIYIRKCTQHLGVDLGCIWIPEREALYPAGRGFHTGDEYSERMLLGVAQRALRLFNTGHGSIGINETNDPVYIKEAFPQDYKILAVPVLDKNSTCRGVLLCMNRHDRQDFTFSDMMTAEAVSKKVRKHLNETEDDLTHLYNLRGFEENINRILSSGENRAHLAVFDIRQFSVINGAYGTGTGDQVLIELGRHLHAINRDRGVTARIAGDQFALFIDIEDGEEATRHVENIRQSAHELSFHGGDKQFSVKLDTSLVELNSGSTTLSYYLYIARLALDTPESDEDEDISIIRPDSTTLINRRAQLVLVEDIKHALEENRFVLYAQNIRSLKDEHDHYEILVRMLDENGDIVPPNDFLPTAERYRLMPQVDRWVFNRTIAMLDEHRLDESHPHIKWGINLAGGSLSDRQFLNHVSEALKNTSMIAANLYFEITETTAIENYKQCVSFMNHIHSMGIRFALDDFGSGVSSFGYLQKLSIDYLKIDGCLVRDIVSNKLDYTMVSAITQIAEVLAVKTIAEYAENEAVIEKLRALNIDYAQGYGIAKPAPLTDVISALQSNDVHQEHMQVYR